MTTEIKKELKVLNISEKEITVFLSILKNKKSTPRSIEKDTGISRSGIYKFIDTLIKKELVFVKNIDRKKTYHNHSLEKIFTKIKILKKKEINKLEKIQKKLEIYEEKEKIEEQKKVFLSQDINELNLILESVLKNKENTY